MGRRHVERGVRTPRGPRFGLGVPAGTERGQVRLPAGRGVDGAAVAKTLVPAVCLVGMAAPDVGSSPGGCLPLDWHGHLLCMVLGVSTRCGAIN